MLLMHIRDIWNQFLRNCDFSETVEMISWGFYIDVSQKENDILVKMKNAAIFDYFIIVTLMYFIQK